MELPPSPSTPNDDISGRDHCSQISSDPNLSSHGGNHGVLFDRRFPTTRIFGTYSINPQPESSRKFHHSMAIEVTLAAAGSRFLHFVLHICFDIGTVDNIAANIEPVDTATDANQEMSVKLGVDKHVNCSGNGSNKACWQFRQDQARSSLLSKYHLQLEVDSKPLLVGYKLHAIFKDHQGASHEFKISEARCLHDAHIRHKIP